tara:strand:- start:1291 stop:1914 length:624 start_codon:yes stop_codon:yes gene_type:complete
MVTTTSNGCKLFGQWCACGKPWEFDCDGTIPHDYFHPLSLETAAAVRGLYLSETYKCYLHKPKLQFGINIHYNNFMAITELYNPINNAKYQYTFPSKSDTLTTVQNAALNNLDWGAFTSTLPKFKSVDVVVCVYDGGQFLVRLIIKDESMQIFANGDKFIFKISDNDVREISAGPSKEWVKFNTGKYRVDKLEVAFASGHTNFISLQ